MLKMTKRGLAGGLAIAAASFPSIAQARWELNPPVAASSTPAPVQQATPAAQPGFQWGDAGIGAAGATLIVGAGALAAGSARRRREPRTAVS
jgi:hypothetical protein